MIKIELYRTIFLYNSRPKYAIISMLSYTEMQASATIMNSTATAGKSLLDEFMSYMDDQGMSVETVKSYFGNVGRYFKWCEESFGLPPENLYRANIRDFKSYLQNVKRFAPSTINYYLSALAKLDEFLIEKGYQSEQAVSKNDYITIQTPVTNPWDGEEKEVKAFLQQALASKSDFCIRDYAIFTVIAYAGPRNSETVSLLDGDVDLVGREVLIRDGKGEKARVAIINDKIINAVEEYRKTRPETDCPYLFLNRYGGKLTRGRINQICNQYSDSITPHKLRHFWCSQSQEVAGYTIAETAAQAGHKDTRTTLRYTHPSKAKLKEKANLLFQSIHGLIDQHINSQVSQITLYTILQINICIM